MAHAHGGPGEKPEEIHAYANALFKGGAPLATITGQGVEKGEAWATFTAKAPVVKAELSFTRDAGKWPLRKWESVAATLKDARAAAPIPDGAKVYYLNLFDERNLVVSTEHVEQN